MFPGNAYGETFTQYLLRRAEMIYRKVQKRGPLQVRWYAGQLLTYPWPERRRWGQGVRGTLIAVYTPATEREWIRADLLALCETADAETSHAAR